MNSELTDYIDSIEEDTEDINRAVEHAYAKLKHARNLAKDLQDELKCEEDRNNDLENKVDHLESFIAEYNDLYVAWQVANRMES